MNHNCIKLFAILFLFMALSVSSPQRAAAQCEDFSADFMFEVIHNDTLLLLVDAEEYDSVAWTISGGDVLADYENSVFVLMLQDTVEVCLSVINADGCEAELCRTIFDGHAEEMCALTDCIWPGDTDGDGMANNYDLLNLGLGFGHSGHPRKIHPIPDNPNYWAPNFNLDWEIDVDNVDLKHVDCNGDGFIDEEDILAIQENYAPAVIYDDTNAEGPPIELLLTPVVVYDNNNPVSVEFKLDVVLGTADKPIEDLHGIAFRIELYDQLSDITDIVPIDLEKSILGGAESLLDVSYLGSRNEQNRFYDYALTRKNSFGIDSFGVVTSFRIISADIVEFLNQPSEPFKLGVVGIRMINSRGQQLPFKLPQDTACVTFVDNLVTNTRAEEILGENITISPNPANSNVFVRLDGDSKAEAYQLINENGQVVLSNEVVEDNTINIDLSEQRAGFYIFRLITDKGVASKKLILK